MLVKIIAVGLNPTLWKNVFHHLRAALPQETFSAGIFSSPEEIAYLEQEYFPAQWLREVPDLILTDPAPPPVWEKRLAFLRRVRALAALRPPVAVLTLHTLEHGLKHLVQGRQPVTFHLDNDSRFSLTDPSLLLPAFPESYPRLRVNPHLSALRLPGKRGRSKEVKPGGLPEGSLLGFSQIESIRKGEEVLPPADWLKAVARVERVRLPANTPVALYREPGGVYLFPGVPVPRVRALTVGGVIFSHLVDLGVLSQSSPGFVALSRAITRAGNRHTATISALTARVRDAESRSDLPVACIGGVAHVSRAMAGLLRGRGYRRAEALPPGAVPGEEEPTLLLRLTPDAEEEEGSRVERPIILNLHEELAPRLALLDDLFDWRALEEPARGDSSAKHPAAQELTQAALLERCGKLKAREEKARSGLEFAERRILLLEQEGKVLAAAREKLGLLLSPPVRTWKGPPQEKAKQVLVLSHDGEEAQYVLQALTGVAKKRWFDLAPCTSADAVQNLDLAPVQTYARGGMAVITAASRERVAALQEEFTGEAERAEALVGEARAALADYREEIAKVNTAKTDWAVRWIRQTLADWLRGNERRLLDALGVLRARHERDWFNRGRINRVVIAAANGENRKALLEACQEVYPHFNPELSVIVPYDFEPLDTLPEAERQAIVAAEQRARHNEKQIAARLAEALTAQNERNLEDYLRVIAPEVEKLPRADLLLIENRPEIAERLLHHLRELTPALAEAPGVMVLPDTWNPPPGGRLAWPRTRTIVIRRMGTLTAPVCAEGLRALHPM